MFSRSSNGGFGGAVRTSAERGFAAKRAPRHAGKPVVAVAAAIGVCAVAAGLLLAGCGKKASKTPAPPSSAPAAQAAAPVPTSPAASPVNPESPRDVQEKQLIAQAVAMREGKAPPPPSMQLRGGEPATSEVLAAYNQRLAQLIFQRRDGPETLEELVRKWPMPGLPTPPPGKQIVYDARYRIIKLYPP